MASCFLLGSLIAARRVAGVRFAEVPKILYEKISGRVAAGTIDDKENRPDELK